MWEEHGNTNWRKCNSNNDKNITKNQFAIGNAGNMCR